jgi:hypothetical protein
MPDPIDCPQDKRRSGWPKNIPDDSADSARRQRLDFTTNILPNNVSLKDTTFKLIADATKNVPESNEKNNETWHNLK